MYHKLPIMHFKGLAFGDMKALVKENQQESCLQFAISHVRKKVLWSNDNKMHIIFNTPS